MSYDQDPSGMMQSSVVQALMQRGLQPHHGGGMIGGLANAINPMIGALALKGMQKPKPPAITTQHMGSTPFQPGMPPPIPQGIY